MQWYFPDGTIDEETYLSDAGYSPHGILVTVFIAALVIISLIVHSFIKLDNRMPIHGNLSAVISAMCQSAEGLHVHDQVVEHKGPQENMAEKEVMWGVVKAAKDGLSLGNEIKMGDNGAGHCAFTAEAVDAPAKGKRYR